MEGSAMVHNVHQREFRTTEGRLGELLDRVAEPDGPLWPRRWPPIRWLHDAVLEELLDRAGAAVGDPPARPARWSPWVRVCRRLLRAGASVPAAR
jgi:hypothetical protein